MLSDRENRRRRGSPVISEQSKDMDIFVLFCFSGEMLIMTAAEKEILVRPEL